MYYYFFKMIFVKVKVKFRIRFHNLEFRIPKLVLDPCGSGYGSGSTTLMHLSKFHPFITRDSIGKPRLRTLTN
jgi:hypothetical protein